MKTPVQTPPGLLYVSAHATFSGLTAKELDGALLSPTKSGGELDGGFTPLSVADLVSLAAKESVACVVITVERAERSRAIEVSVSAGLPRRGRNAWLGRLRALVELARSLDGCYAGIAAAGDTLVPGRRLSTTDRAEKPLSARATADLLSSPDHRMVLELLEDRARPPTPKLRPPESRPAPPELEAAVRALARGTTTEKEKAAMALVIADWRPGWELVAAELDFDDWRGGTVAKSAVAALFRLGSSHAFDALVPVFERVKARPGEAHLAALHAFEWLAEGPQSLGATGVAPTPPDPRWVDLARELKRDHPHVQLRGMHKVFLSKVKKK